MDHETCMTTSNPIEDDWVPSYEEINLREDVKWLENTTNIKILYEKLLKWMKRGPQLLNVDGETDFIDPDMLHNVIQVKCHTFNEFEVAELRKARCRANVFETIRNGIFMNRAAMKMANIDAITDFTFTSLDYNSVHKRDGPYYFADVCAGPGGFSEYILWRKKWCYKGFGFTLKGANDFKLNESTCISADSFRAFYGTNRDGNIYNPDNIKDFKEIVLGYTQGVGVHFMMSDGGFSVEGNENLQEVLSKQIYVCQCLMALYIIRPHGYFVTKMFDLVTKFSVGLIYLMHLCFDKIAIVKPNTSRPANSERYLICKDFKNTSRVVEIRKYLEFVVQDLWVKQQCKDKVQDDDNEIVELVPLEILKRDTKFATYMFESNTTIAEKQVVGLLKLRCFCRDPNLIETRQDISRSKCLNLWRIPDRKRSTVQIFTPETVTDMISQPAFMLTQPKELADMKNFKTVIDDMSDWRFVPMISTKQVNFCHIFVGVSNSKVCKLMGNQWIKVKNMHLNKGTLLYGETVKEKCVSWRTGVETEKLCLQVIDALRLGDISLADLSFEERAKSIRIFCEAINFEVEPDDVRIRLKEARFLHDMYTQNIVEYKHETREYITHMDPLGPKNSNEFHSVNSLLFLKINSHQTFNSTYVLRSVVYINEHDLKNDAFKLIDVMKQIRSLNKK
ncbi:FtsJ-like methyltransferase [Popillia japonica]|uniref:Cap-specific mRNA (nucleoside-2'-O-)-methyltransferase 1 n=1 Tax=Popillia japonica TaxID=7064 RepID=A0AAW1KH88_POPJA